MTTTVTTRNAIASPREDLGSSFAGSFALHGAVAALLLGWAYLTHSGKNWGSADATNGAIQAAMVSAIPLPPKPISNPDSVLSTDNPSLAPAAPTPHTVEAPRPDAIPIPVKPTKPAPVAEKTTPPPPTHPQPLKVDPNKVQTGQAPTIQTAMSVMPTQAGTSSVGVTDNAFGTRFAFYIQQINRKLASQWLTQMLDAQAPGRRVFITFQIARDGSPSNIRIAQPSGDATLDQTALNAVRHVDTFGPLPDAYQGNYVNAQYYFEPPPRQ